VIIEVDAGAGEFRKRAETGEEAARLDHEARVLEVARHPGVVEFLGRDGETLRLRLVNGRPLSGLVLPRDDELVRIARATATTLADLHDIGVVHRALSADHLMIDSDGQPILCSFGRALSGAVGPDEARAEVAALAAAVSHGGTAAGTTGPTIAAIEAAAARAAHHPQPARYLATLLAENRAGAPTTGRRRTKAVRAVGPVLAAAAIAVGAAAVSWRVGGGARPAAEACPAVDLGCHPLAHPGGIIATPAGRYRIGGPGDLFVVGRWRCAAALPALLQPASGKVWIWDQWARAGAPGVGRLVARIPGARDVQVEPGPSACDRLLVTLGDGTVAVVRPDQPA
jgi:hypothetical protein